MIKSFKFLIMFLLIGTIATQTSAQVDNVDVHDVQIVIPEVALLDIEPAGSKDIILTITEPSEEGDPLDFSTATNNTLYLNYSSIIGSTTESVRVVTAAITAGTMPGGMLLKVTAGADEGNGKGTVGATAGAVTLSGTAQNVVTGIGSCYTNSPEGNGHQLTYALEVDATNYGDLDFDDATTLTITYTLSDN